MEENERRYRYEVVLKEKDKDGLFLTIPIDEYNLDFIVHAYTAMTQLNLFCVIKDNKGEITDSEDCQAFTIPWSEILYIHQISGLKTTIEKANNKIDKDSKLHQEINEKYKKENELNLKQDVSVV